MIPWLDLVLKWIKTQHLRPKVPITSAILLKIKSGLGKVVLADFKQNDVVISYLCKYEVINHSKL